MNYDRVKEVEYSAERWKGNTPMWNAWNFQMIGRGNKVRLQFFLANFYPRFTRWVWRNNAEATYRAMLMTFFIGMMIIGTLVILSYFAFS